MTLYILRQGQTTYNAVKIFNGVTETALTPLGVEQAGAQRDAIKNLAIDVCFCSPQQRTRQTCTLAYDGEIVFDDRLIEIDCGEFEGTAETPESFKAFFAASLTGARGVERFDAFLRRMGDFCDMLTAQFKDKNILVCTHAANVRYLNYDRLGKPKDYNWMQGVGCEGGLIVLEQI